MTVLVPTHPHRLRRWMPVAAAAVLAGLMLTTLQPIVANAETGVAIERLETEATAELLGLDDPNPDLSWILASAQRGVMQSAYQIVVATTADKAAAGNGDVWDSGRVASDSTAVPYSGPALESRTRYFWAVKAWVPEATPWSTPTWFETAYLDESEWQGDWISGEPRPTALLTADEGAKDDACCRASSSTLALPADAGATNLRLGNAEYLATGQSIDVGRGASLQTVQVTTVGTGALPAISLATDAAAGSQRLYVDSTAGWVAGRDVVIGSGSGSETSKVTGVGTAAGTATGLAFDAASGATNVKVQAAEGFAVGELLQIGTGSAAEQRTVTQVGSRAAELHLFAAAAAGATNVKLDSTTGLVVGEQVQLGQQAVTITGVGTAGAAATLSEPSSLPVTGGFTAPSYDNASWIWSTPGAATNAAAGTAQLRRTFPVAQASAVTHAWLRLNVDDRHTAFINGRQVASSEGPNAWRGAQVVDVARYLQDGDNVLAIEAVNDGGAGGAIGALRVETAGGSQLYTTGADWKTGTSSGTAWRSTGFDDSGWTAAAVAAPNGAGPWNALGVPGAPDPAVIRVSSVAGFTVGEEIVIDAGGRLERRTIAAVGTAGVSGTGIRLTQPVSLPHDVAAAVTQLGGGLSFTPGLAAAQTAGTAVTTAGSGITFDAPLGRSHPQGTAIRGLGGGIGLETPLASAHAAGEKVTSYGTGIGISPALAAAQPAGTPVSTTPVDVCRPPTHSKNSAYCKPIRPTFLMRKDFAVSPVSEHGAVTSARLYSTGLGWGEPSLNGELVQPDGHLNPGFTDYEDTVQYTTDDVTDLIRQSQTATSQNVIAAELGAGRYDSESVPSNHRFERAQWRALETLRADLYITYADGTEQRISSDDSWKTSTDGPTRYNDFDDGETYDARRELPGWNTPGYDTSGWHAARPVDGPDGQVMAMKQERNEKVADIAGPFPREEFTPGVHVFDTGKQRVGWATVEFWDTEPGDVFRIAFVERRHDDPAKPGTQDGTLEVPYGLQEGYYISDGTGTAEHPETFTPNWAFAGFQWVQVAGSDGRPMPEGAKVDVASVQEVRTNMAETGDFSSSSQILNDIHRLSKTSIAANWEAGYSMDTPTYEKDGWTGDMQLVIPSASLLFDQQRQLKKSSRDVVDSQWADGQVSLLIPGAEGYGYCSPVDGAPEKCGTWPSEDTFKRAGGGASPVWDAVLQVAPWEAYNRYGDTEGIETAYPAMVKYLDVNIAKWLKLDGDGRDYTLSSVLGDWAYPTGVEGDAEAGTDFNPGAIGGEASTAYTAYIAKLTADSARVLHEKTGEQRYADDAARYDELFENVKADFIDTWWQDDLGYFAWNSSQEFLQSYQVLALAFDLVPDGRRLDVQTNLIDDILDTRSAHQMTGIASARWIYPVLTQAAYEGVPRAAEAAYAASQQTSYPSYGYWIAQGWTGLGEYWETTSRTRNHQMYGSIVQWLYENVAGIQIGAPGYKESVFRPLIAPEGPDHAEASYDSVHGELRSSWTRSDDGIELEVTVPANTTAKVYVPTDDADSIREIGSGASHPAGEAPSVEFVGMEGNAAVYAVGSGTYRFTDHQEEAGLDVTVSASSRCIASKAVLQLTAVNGEGVPVDVNLVSPYGSKAITGIAAGKSGFHSFTTRLKELPAGSASAEVSAVIGGVTRTASIPVAFDALRCA